MKGFDSIHPAVYRWDPEMINHGTHSLADEQAAIEDCRKFFPSLPTDRLDAWEWVAFWGEQKFFQRRYHDTGTSVLVARTRADAV